MSACSRSSSSCSIRTYAGALKQVSDQRVVVKPLRAAPEDKDVLVRTEVHGKGEPVQLDFRLENTDGKGWKIYNLNVLGVWMVETYRTQFAQELNKGGIDGLINALGQSHHRCRRQNREVSPAMSHTIALAPVLTG